ncbi:MAG: DNA alkylation repair protein, partial [Candidatus Eisenbacteria bacterium]|nr:DNA alkylation repair protein [Candidatus Eisenbacteria bacterium]
MTAEEVVQALKKKGTKAGVEGMTRYNIPNHRAFGVPMRTMKQFGKEIGKDHS